MNFKRQITVTLAIVSVLTASCKHDPMVGPGNNNTNTPDTKSPKFTTEILPIFIAKCSGCHNNTNANDGYNFTSYEHITAKKFVPGNPDDTKLFEAITDNDEDDRMPLSPNPRLSDDEITLIKNWILNGAPNN